MIIAPNQRKRRYTDVTLRITKRNTGAIAGLQALLVCVRDPATNRGKWLAPTLAGYTGGGYVASNSSVLDANNLGWLPFDSSAPTAASAYMWISDSELPCWINLHMPVAYEILAVRVYGGNVAGTYYGPEEFEVYAHNGAGYSTGRLLKSVTGYAYGGAAEQAGRSGPLCPVTTLIDPRAELLNQWRINIATNNGAAFVGLSKVEWYDAVTAGWITPAMTGNENSLPRLAWAGTNSTGSKLAFNAFDNSAADASMWNPGVQTSGILYAELEAEYRVTGCRITVPPTLATYMPNDFTIEQYTSAGWTVRYTKENWVPANNDVLEMTW